MLYKLLNINSFNELIFCSHVFPVLVGAQFEEYIIYHSARQTSKIKRVIIIVTTTWKSSARSYPSLLSIQTIVTSIPAAITSLGRSGLDGKVNEVKNLRMGVRIPGWAIQMCFLVFGQKQRCSEFGEYPVGDKLAYDIVHLSIFS